MDFKDNMIFDVELGLMSEELNTIQKKVDSYIDFHKTNEAIIGGAKILVVSNLFLIIICCLLLNIMPIKVAILSTATTSLVGVCFMILSELLLNFKEQEILNMVYEFNKECARPLEIILKKNNILTTNKRIICSGILNIFDKITSIFIKTHKQLDVIEDIYFEVPNPSEIDGKTIFDLSKQKNENPANVLEVISWLNHTHFCILLALLKEDGFFN